MKKQPLKTLLTLTLGILGFGSAPLAAALPPSQKLVDISQTHWCYDCIVKLVDTYQVLTGYQDHTFRGDWPIKRDMFAVMVGKVVTLTESTSKQNLKQAGPNNRPIGVAADHWAYHYVHNLSRDYNLMGFLFADQGFQQQKNVTRNEVAYVLTEILERLEKAAHKPLPKPRDLSDKLIDLEAHPTYKPYIIKAIDDYHLLNLYHDHTFRGEQAITRFELSAALCEYMALLDQYKS